MASGAEPSPLRAPADLERANAVCPLSTRQGVPQGHPGTKSCQKAGQAEAIIRRTRTHLRLQQQVTIRSRSQSAILPAKAAQQARLSMLASKSQPQ